LRSWGPKQPARKLLCIQSTGTVGLIPDFACNNSCAWERDKKANTAFRHKSREGPVPHTFSHHTFPSLEAVTCYTFRALGHGGGSFGVQSVPTLKEVAKTFRIWNLKRRSCFPLGPKFIIGKFYFLQHQFHTLVSS
jgi:hypothetical protein